MKFKFFKMSFEILFKNVKHIGIDFTIDVLDLYKKDYKTMLKGIKDALNK